MHSAARCERGAGEHQRDALTVSARTATASDDRSEAVR